MRAAIVHLSDIHFRSKGNPITGKIRQLAAAINSADAAASLFLIVVSGDVAFSARAEEYSVAMEFFDNLRASLKQIRPDADVQFVCVPGNHDCALPEFEENLRDTLINGLLPSLSAGEPDKALLEQVLKAQASFDIFRASLMSANGTWDGICESVTFHHGFQKLQINLYNTALLSRRHEKQGELRLPLAALRSRVSLANDAALCVSVFHHSYLWIESNIAVEFRKHVEMTCDIALSGHQHYPHDFYKLNSTGERVLYLEADALQDDAYLHRSAFRVIVFDFDVQRERVVQFRWNDREKLYRTGDESDWRQLTINRAIRAEFRLNQKFDTWITDIGSPLHHGRKGELKLRDVFVFPDLSVRSRGLGATLREIRGEDVFKYALESERVVFQASALSGKTSLCKVLFSDFVNRSDQVPLLLSGHGVDSADEARSEKLFWRLFEEQYNPSMLDAFRQLEKARRTLFIDDWHKTALNPDGRQLFLETAGRYFGRILLFADEFFPLQELLEGSAKTILEFEHATVEQFRHALRGKIIDRWVTLGQEHTGDKGKMAREIEEKENLVRSLIGKNILPSLPFVVLCILEAEQEDKAQSSEAGSFGYLYEVLVTTALNATKGPKTQLEKKYVFLARLAYHMFKQDVESLPTTETRRIAEEYSRSHLVKVDIDAMLADLEDARVLRRVNGNYSFAYGHFFYYFVARYYKDNLDRTEGGALRQELEYMADHLSRDRYTAILMFVLYFSRDSAGIITRIVENANSIYKNEEPANLNSDVNFLNQFCDQPYPDIPEEVDLAASRTERREFRDRIEKTAERMIHPEARVYTYSEDLADKDKFDLAQKHIELLGQVIRNFPGSLPGPEKLAILEACYSLGLRSIRALLRLIESSIPMYREAVLKTRKDLGNATAEEIRRRVDSTVILLSRICVLGNIKRVSSSVGLADLEAAYREALANLGKTNATQLIDLSIKLDHFAEFPESYVRELHRLFSGNGFADRILADLVVGHMLVFDLDRKVRQSMSALFNIKANLPQFLDSTRKN